MQHRKVYIDDWCLMEKICLVSAVLRLGDSNWSSVCELIKPKLQENRPWDWFTPDACEAQYQVLFHECVKTQINEESPALQIIQNLKTKCKTECQLKDEQRNKYLALKKKIENFLKSGVENEVIDKYYEDVQREKKEKEENLRRHQEALKRRETLKQEFESANVPRTPNKQETKTESGPSPIVTSPLLSSLLNNPPAIQYRPTLSTSSFIPTKTAQSLSKSSSFEKLQSFTSDASFKDRFSSELAEQISSLDRQPAPVASSSATIIKKLESQDSINTMPIVSGNRTPVSDSSASRILTSSTETTPKSDQQNLENLRLISPNDEEYLTEVDIPPEALLEVIGDLKEGTISLDKLIRDLEATDEGVIIDKDLQTVSIPLNEPYVIDNKPIEQTPYTPEVSSEVQLTDEKKPEFIDDSKIEVSEVEVEHSDLSLTEHDKADTEEQVIIVEDTDRKEHKMHTTDTEDIANIEINDVDISVTKDESPSSSSFSSTVAVSAELDSSFSEHKSDNETVESPVIKSVSTKNNEAELEEDIKSKYPSKPVVVIKRIEDGTNSNKNKKSKCKILEEAPKEAENLPSEADGIRDEKELQPEEVIVTTTEHQAVEEIQQTSHESETNTSVFEESIVIEDDIDSKDEEKIEDNVQSIEPVEPLCTADDSDVSDKFEDALQAPIEETNETEITDTTCVVETETKSPPCVDLDESFELNVSEENPAENLTVEEIQQNDEKQLEIPAAEQITQVIVNEVENLEQNESETVENIPIVESNEDNNATLDDSKVNETVQEIVEESKKPEDVKPPPAKIIKSSKRKRKITSETSEATPEMSIVIPSVALKEIETVDSDIEQTFTPVHNIKIEPSDLKPEDERKEQEKETSVIEKSIPRRESTPARIKSERRDTKTPEPVVMVLRRSSNKTQSPMKKIDRESRNMDNSELVKTRKKSIMLAYSRLTTHKYANAFQKPITNRQAPGYESTIYKPMDLHTIKKKIDNKQISTVAEFQRDILLMLNNAKMFNRINSQVYNMAVEVEEDALPNIQYTVQNLGEGVFNKIQKTSEKPRKRPSLDNRKDLKLIKRIKYSTKDDSFPNQIIKKPKLEENEDE